jgi:AGZA family xanthine/uracil permease-like MFS transporter
MTGTSLKIRFPIFRTGDINAFFGLMLDNMTQLVILAAILTGVFNFPKEIVLYKIIPGTAVGVFLGDLLYTWMAVRLARRTGRTDVTAMPLGIDTPSLFAFAFGIIGPAYLATHDADLAWKISMAVIVLVGLSKIAASWVAPLIRKALPRAGMLGPIAAIAILLIAFFPALKIFHNPVVGFLSLGIILVCIIGKIRFPGNLPGAAAGVLFGSAVFYLLYFLGLSQDAVKILAQSHTLQFALPVPTFLFMEGLTQVLPYLPLAIPFAIVVMVGGIDVTESAAATGDDYPTRHILLTDGLATLMAGLCGGVVQTTPYIGHPAYKEMGGGAGYTLGVALFIGLGGVLGYLSFMVDLIPEAAVAPILIFIGLEITAQAFGATPKHHHKAVVLAFLPLIAYLVLIQVNHFLGGTGIRTDSLKGDLSDNYHAILVLANGFIVTSLLWSSTLVHIIDHRLGKAAVFMGIAALFSLFGIIHSPFDNGSLFLPWSVDSATPFTFCGAYLIVALFLFFMNIYRGK